VGLKYISSLSHFIILLKLCLFYQSVQALRENTEKEDLNLPANEIRVDKKEVRLAGSYSAMTVFTYHKSTSLTGMLIYGIGS